MSEEERLRKLEQQRRSGELQRVEKSAVDRSSEAGAEAMGCQEVFGQAVASKLMQPSKEPLGRDRSEVARGPFLFMCGAPPGVPGPRAVVLGARPRAQDRCNGRAT